MNIFHLSGRKRKNSVPEASSGTMLNLLQRVFCNVKFILLALCASTVILLLVRHPKPVESDPDKGYEQMVESEMRGEEDMSVFQKLVQKVAGQDKPVLAHPPVLAPPPIRHPDDTIQP